MFEEFKENLIIDLESILITESEKKLFDNPDFINYFIRYCANPNISHLINWTVGKHELDPKLLPDTQFIGINKLLDSYIVNRVLFWFSTINCTSKKVDYNKTYHLEFTDLDNQFNDYSNLYEILEEY